METNLTNDDLTILLEALTEWENKDAFSGLLSGVIGTILMDKTPEGKAKFEEEQKAEAAKREAAKRDRTERSIMLKAKLVMLRPRATAFEIDAGMRR